MTSPAAHTCPPRGGGFTLIELLAVIVVLVVLIALGVPSFAELTASQRVQTMAAELHSSLLRARSEAIKQNANVTVARAGTWEGGWVVSSASGNIEVHGPATGIAITLGPASVVYNNTGRISGAAPKFEFSKASLTSTKRCLQVSLSGQPVVTKGACP